MKSYFQTIALIQEWLLIVSIVILVVLPILLVFRPDSLSENFILHLYDISHITVFFVMVIRPLADIITSTRYIRPLVILRKGMGVLSASIVVSFILSKIIMDAGGYFGSFTTASYWSFENFAILAHLADISAVILLITSNNFSKRLLGAWWKRIQKLSYVYFFASSLYVFIVLQETAVLYSMIIVSILTFTAYIKNNNRIVITKPL